VVGKEFGKEECVSREREREKERGDWNNWKLAWMPFRLLCF